MRTTVRGREAIRLFVLFAQILDVVAQVVVLPGTLGLEPEMDLPTGVSIQPERRAELADEIQRTGCDNSPVWARCVTGTVEGLARRRVDGCIDTERRCGTSSEIAWLLGLVIAYPCCMDDRGSRSGSTSRGPRSDSTRSHCIGGNSLSSAAARPPTPCGLCAPSSTTTGR